MIQAGQLITDGTAAFIIDDVRDGNRVGDIIMRHTLREGFIKANGAVVAASDYPRLLRYVQDNKLTVSEEEWQAGQYAKYVYNSNADTLRLPNMMGRFLEGGDEIAAVEAGLPNITGVLSGNGFYSDTTGALCCIWEKTSYRNANNSSYHDAYYQVNFNAARSSTIYGNSDTVQPPAIKLIAQIKY